MLGLSNKCLCAHAGVHAEVTNLGHPGHDLALHGLNTLPGFPDKTEPGAWARCTGYKQQRCKKSGDAKKCSYAEASLRNLNFLCRTRCIFCQASAALPWRRRCRSMVEGPGTRLPGRWPAG